MTSTSSTSSEPEKKTWERRLDEAKSKHRPKLKNWSRDGFAFQREKDFLKSRELKPEHQHHKIDVVDCSSIDKVGFVRIYEENDMPCVIKDIPNQEGWNAATAWTQSKLNSRFKDRYFKCGEDDDGYKVKTRLKYFLKYMKNNKDDSPLYVFDGNFDGDDVSRSLLSDYKVPSYFTDDLFSLVGEKRRPPYRWILLGPERSGSSVHIDPLATSAWNTILVGRKRWVLFPPETPKSIAKGLDVIQKGEDDEAINYFVDLLPRIREKHGHNLKIYELIQEPGETIFVPGGWWHGVLNLEDTIAVTQNFCSCTNFPSVWRSTRKGRPKMSVRWLKELSKQYPDLAAQALLLNDQDQFTMYDKETDRKKKEAEELKRKQKKAAKKQKNKDNTASEESKSSHPLTAANLQRAAPAAPASNAVSQVSSSAVKAGRKRSDSTSSNSSTSSGSSNSSSSSSSSSSTNSSGSSGDSYIGRIRSYASNKAVYPAGVNTPLVPVVFSRPGSSSSTNHTSAKHFSTSSSSNGSSQKSSHSGQMPQRQESSSSLSSVLGKVRIVPITTEDDQNIASVVESSASKKSDHKSDKKKKKRSLIEAAEGPSGKKVAPAEEPSSKSEESSKKKKKKCTMS